jgi:hypothetical protein
MPGGAGHWFFHTSNRERRGEGAVSSRRRCLVAEVDLAAVGDDDLETEGSWLDG